MPIVGMDAPIREEDWSSRVLSPLGRMYNTIPDRGFDPFAANEPETRDRYYTPEDMKRRVLNPVDVQDVAYRPDNVQEKKEPPLNDWVDEQMREYDAIPDSNTPIPGLEDLEPEVDPNNRIGQFSRPIAFPEGYGNPDQMMKLGGPTDPYQELPLSIREAIERDYPGKPSTGQSRAVIGQHTAEDFREHKAKAWFSPEELEEFGLDPEDTSWYNNPTEEMLNLPPRTLPMLIYDNQNPGTPMNLGGPEGYGDPDYIPQGYGDEAAINGGIDPENKVPTNWWTGRGKFGGSPGEWGPQKTMQFITEGISALMDHLNTLRNAGDVSARVRAAEALELDPRDLGLFSGKEAEAGAASAFGLASGGIMRGYAGQGSFGMFGGRGAAVTSGANIAENRLRMGEDPQIVRADTGWFRGADGKMKFIIDPKLITVKPEPKIYSIQTSKGEAKVTPLASIIDHPTLFAEYPELAGKGFIQIDNSLPTGSAQYLKTNGLHMIKMNLDTTNPKWKSTVVHEINHALQELEDFARGADYTIEAKKAKPEVDEIIAGKEPSGDIKDLIDRQMRIQRQGGETIDSTELIGLLRASKTAAPRQHQIMREQLAEAIGIDRYHRTAGEVDSRLAESLLHLSKGEIDSIDLSRAGDVPVEKRIFTYWPQNKGSLSKGRGFSTDPELNKISNELVDRLRRFQYGDEPSTNMTLVQRDIQKLEQKVTEMEAEGRRVIAEDVAGWLELAGVEGVSIKESPGGTKYVIFNDPVMTNSIGKVRVPDDEHIALKRAYNTTDTGTKMPRELGRSSEGQRERALQATSNVSGGNFAIWENLVDALKWRLSRSPDGQWLVSPGQEPKPYTKAAKAENTGDVISRDPNQLELPLMQPQIEQLQQAKDNRPMAPKSMRPFVPKEYSRKTTPKVDERIYELSDQGLPQREVVRIVNEELKGIVTINKSLVQERLTARKRLANNPELKSAPVRPAEEQPVEIISRPNEEVPPRRRWTQSHIAVADTPDNYHVNLLKQEMGPNKTDRNQIGALGFIEKTLRKGDDFPTKAQVQKEMGWKKEYAEALYFQTMLRLQDRGFLGRNNEGQFFLRYKEGKK